MIHIALIAVGKMKEKFYMDASAEYVKRLGAFCKLEVIEIAESRLPQTPSGAEINAALKAEAAKIAAVTPVGAALVALCIEGKPMSSERLSAVLDGLASSGTSKLAFVIGGSFGLNDELKRHAELRLSMSAMTFPHHLARVMLLEQLYRAFSISAGTKYHK